MAKRTPAQIAEQARARIDQIRRTLVEFDSLCSGTLQALRANMICDTYL